MAEFVFQILADALLQAAGYATGWLVVPIFSLGRVFVEARRNGASVHPEWHRVGRASDGTWFLDAEMGSLMGLVFWFAVAGIWYLAHSAST